MLGNLDGLFAFMVGVIGYVLNQCVDERVLIQRFRTDHHVGL